MTSSQLVSCLAGRNGRSLRPQLIESSLFSQSHAALVWNGTRTEDNSKLFKELRKIQIHRLKVKLQKKINNPLICCLYNKLAMRSARFFKGFDPSIITDRLNFEQSGLVKVEPPYELLTIDIVEALCAKATEATDKMDISG